LYLETSEKDEESYSSEDEEVIFSIIITILIRFISQDARKIIFCIGYLARMYYIKIYRIPKREKITHFIFLHALQNMILLFRLNLQKVQAP
jgi:hypothetical protein